jgi:hypothetical protein
MAALPAGENLFDRWFAALGEPDPAVGAERVNVADLGQPLCAAG